MQKLTCEDARTYNMLIKFFDGLELAKIDTFKDNEYIYNDTICLSPTEKYLQIIDNDFTTATKVELVNCKGQLVEDVTTRVILTTAGVLEIAPLNTEYFENVYFKINGKYSNSFIVVEDNENTIRIDYKHYNIYQNINYTLKPFYQGIRLKMYKSKTTHKETKNVYTEINGNIQTGREVQATEYNYDIDNCSSFVAEKLGYILNHEFLYLDSIKTIVSKIDVGERNQKANIQKFTFTAQQNNNDVFTPTYQVLEHLQLINKIPTPQSLLNLATQPIQIEGIFYRNIKTDFSKLIYFKDYTTDAVVYTGIIVSDFTDFTTDEFYSIIGGGLPAGKYYINILFGTFDDVYNSGFELTDKSWWFEIRGAEYVGKEYNNEYFI